MSEIRAASYLTTVELGLAVDVIQIADLSPANLCRLDELEAR